MYKYPIQTVKFLQKSGDILDLHMKLRQLTDERGWTEYRLAKECGLSESTIANIFRRNTTPSISTLEAICRGFGITLSQFFAEGEMLEMTPGSQRAGQPMDHIDAGSKKGDSGYGKSTEQQNRVSRTQKKCAAFYWSCGPFQQSAASCSSAPGSCAGSTPE